MTDILTKAYDKLQDEYERLGLQPERVSRFGLKPGWNAVIGENGCCGIAMSFGGNNPNYDRAQTDFEIGELKACIGAPLFDLARDNLGSPAIRRRSIAVAAMNALSQPLVRDKILEEKGFEVAVEVSRLVKEGDVIAIVGYGGLVKEYTGRCRELHVTDQRPVSSFVTTMIGESVEHFPDNVCIHPENENEEVLSRADVVFITGSTLVNGTFDELARYAKNARLRCLYGSSAQLVPDVLFENGIDVVMSVAITDPAQFELDVKLASDMEGALKSRQRKYTVYHNGTG